MSQPNDQTEKRGQGPCFVNGEWVWDKKIVSLGLGNWTWGTAKRYVGMWQKKRKIEVRM